MRKTSSRAVLGIGLLGALLAACDNDGPITTGSTSTDTTSSTAGNGGTTSAGGSGGTGATGGGGSSSTGGGGAGGSGGTASTGGGGTGGTGGTTVTITKYSYCTKQCGTVADCCPAGLPPDACPSTMYPYNYQCVQNACHAAECTSTADCTAQVPGSDCFDLAGYHACGTPCTGDEDCTAPQTCSGADSDGKKYCLSLAGGCQDDTACGGLGKCVNKLCTCESDADCTKPGFTKCVIEQP